MTTLPSTKHKLSFFYNNQSKCNCHLNITGNGSPESTTESNFRVDIFQATLTYTSTNRLLFEAVVSPNSTPFPTTVLADSTEVPITNSGFNYRGPALLFSGRDYKIKQQSYRASMAYVTGSHNLKVGWDMLRGLFQPDQVPVLGGLTYTFASNVPTAVTLAAVGHSGFAHTSTTAWASTCRTRWTCGARPSPADCASTCSVSPRTK